jgi:hypothetical protein
VVLDDWKSCLLYSIDTFAGLVESGNDQHEVTTARNVSELSVTMEANTYESIDRQEGMVHITQ